MSHHNHILLPSYTGAIPIGNPEEMKAAMRVHDALERELNIRNGYIDAETLSKDEIASLDIKYPGWKSKAETYAKIRAKGPAMPEGSKEMAQFLSHRGLDAKYPK